MTKEEAIRLYDSGIWKEWSDYERAYFQLNEEKLCMPFKVFHAAVEKALGRPVWTHEFGRNWSGLLDELEGKAGKPTFDDIIDLIPTEKRMLVFKEGD